MEVYAPISQPSPQDLRKQHLRTAAQEFEASFLTEMLDAAGLGASRQMFGGGAGEDQFASFLLQEQARAMVRVGGIGLSESIYEALKERENERKTG